VRRGEVTLVVPHRARLPLEGPDRVRLPDGQAAHIVQGRIRPYGEVIGATLGTSPAEWAWQQFAGAPYLWGGVTTAGIDCSGLVQVTFLARGIPLPRNATQQTEFGADVPRTTIGAGDLLFMRGAASDDISHVAIAVDPETLVHSTVATGGVTRESWGTGSRAAYLRERLVAVRRLT
jgi:cell wall-associated NlpC family hydrolase